ncbi:hypothetical protein GCM10011324_35570 [Allosediminivita pacifica]|nr:hypothetical protein GCM10011324_35570 [Allosediminivita pacifica]
MRPPYVLLGTEPRTAAARGGDPPRRSSHFISANPKDLDTGHPVPPKPRSRLEKGAKPRIAAARGGDPTRRSSHFIPATPKDLDTRHPVPPKPRSRLEKGAKPRISAARGGDPTRRSSHFIPANPKDPDTRHPAPPNRRRMEARLRCAAGLRPLIPRRGFALDRCERAHCVLAAS